MYVLTNNQDAFGLDLMTAVKINSLDTYEEIKRRGSNAPKAAASNSDGNRQSSGDTADAIELAELGQTDG